MSRQLHFKCFGLNRSENCFVCSFHQTAEFIQYNKSSVYMEKSFQRVLIVKTVIDVCKSCCKLEDCFLYYLLDMPNIENG